MNPNINLKFNSPEKIHPTNNRNKPTLNRRKRVLKIKITTQRMNFIVLKYININYFSFINPDF